MNKFEKWCNDLKYFWEHQEIESIINLFDEQVVYYENPKMRLASISEIRKIWEEIKEQNVDSIEFKILCIDHNKCIVNYILNDKTSYDMIYEIELNQEDKCTFFRQWYMEFE